MLVTELRHILLYMNLQVMILETIILQKIFSYDRNFNQDICLSLTWMLVSERDPIPSFSRIPNFSAGSFRA